MYMISEDRVQCSFLRDKLVFSEGFLSQNICMETVCAVLDLHNQNSKSADARDLSAPEYPLFIRQLG